MRIVVACAFVLCCALGCRSVTDPIAHLELKNNVHANARSACVRDCNAAFKAALRACGHNKACKSAARDAKRTCKRDCYNEGGGQGG